MATLWALLHALQYCLNKLPAKLIRTAAAISQRLLLRPTLPTFTSCLRRRRRSRISTPQSPQTPSWPAMTHSPLVTPPHDISREHRKACESEKSASFFFHTNTHTLTHTHTCVFCIEVYFNVRSDCLYCLCMRCHDCKAKTATTSSSEEDIDFLSRLRRQRCNLQCTTLLYVPSKTSSFRSEGC